MTSGRQYIPSPQKAYNQTTDLLLRMISISPLYATLHLFAVCLLSEERANDITAVQSNEVTAIRLAAQRRTAYYILHPLVHTGKIIISPRMHSMYGVCSTSVCPWGHHIMNPSYSGGQTCYSYSIGNNSKYPQLVLVHSDHHTVHRKREKERSSVHPTFCGKNAKTERVGYPCRHRKESALSSLSSLFFCCCGQQRREE